MSVTRKQVKDALSAVSGTMAGAYWCEGELLNADVYRALLEAWSVIQSVEFAAEASDGTPLCPICDASRGEEPHDPKCKLAAVLRQMRGET